MWRNIQGVRQVYICIILYSTHTRAYLRGGGGSGGSNPPRNFQIFFLKSEGKEIERKRKKGMLEGGGAYLLTYFWG